MGKRLLYTITMLLAVLLAQTASAQDKPEMADLMRSNGKIYAVVAVCLTILIGLFFYVFTIDRRITRLEKEKN